MRTLVAFGLLVVGYVALNLITAGINFIGDNYSNTLGPITLLGGVVALAVWAFKKGN